MRMRMHSRASVSSQYAGDFAWPAVVVLSKPYVGFRILHTAEVGIYDMLFILPNMSAAMLTLPVIPRPVFYLSR